LPVSQLTENVIYLMHITFFLGLQSYMYIADSVTSRLITVKNDIFNFLRP